MGKRRKLNKFITKWIKSDLPEDRSTVLLLGVTRIPTSPVPARRPCSLPLTACTNPSTYCPQSFRTANHAKFRRKSRSDCPNGKSLRCSLAVDLRYPELAFGGGASTCTEEGGQSSDTDSASTPSNNFDTNDKNSIKNDTTPAVMDKSVDSIGTCSLDFDVSAEMSDPSEGSSVATLRSISIPTTSPEHRLPSYLSLACTVNGYSTTTNYDPERLSRSRDASPHRLHDHDQDPLTYTIQNNLLSPPNLVPLPIQSFKRRMDLQNKENMAEHTITSHHQYFSSTKTVSYISKETRNYSSSIISNDSVDACLENGHRNGIQNKCVSYSTKNSTTVTSNNQNKCITESSVQEYSNGNECKSFIQQRVERLYGPGALAQGFFVKKRQKNRLSESETDKNSSVKENESSHSKSMVDQFNDGESSPNMKQSTSSPALPVLRHLRPEFRAQLPISSPKKGVESPMQKSSTTPTLKSDNKTNGYAKETTNASVQINGSDILNKKDSQPVNEVVKDGHWFINILEIEAKRLLEMAAEAEEELEQPDLPEEAKGYLRSASGKARLLVTQKMQQFKGLCTNNITQVEGEAFPTTNEDLQGFWDMLMLQVDQIDKLFKEISLLRINGWKEADIVNKPISTANKTKKVIKSSRPTNAAAEDARKQRDAQRKAMIEQRRKAMREQQQQPASQQSIEIFVPESS